jgi:hypothetical protein
VKGLIGRLTGVRADDVVDRNAGLFALVMVLLMLASFALCMLGIRLFTNRLRPFAHDLPTRKLGGRRKAAPAEES